MHGVRLGLLGGIVGRVRVAWQGVIGGICFRHDCRRIDAALRVERRRIARELHDALGNRLVVIGMHARELPESERPAAERIRGLAQLAMQDVRQVIGVLHGADNRVADEAPPRGRLLSDDVTALAGLLPAGRMMVSFEGIGLETVLPRAVHHTVFAMVQECVTNAIKHGDARPVVVRLAFGDELAVTVVNGLSASPPPRRRRGFGLGLGLDGIRARALEQGGSAEWGVDAGMFRVRVVLPLAGVLCHA